MKKIISTTLLIWCAILGGCGTPVNYDLPDNPTQFILKDYINPNDEEDQYASIEYNGRIYIPYGTLSGNMAGNHIDQCLGYCVQDGEVSRDRRIYTLKDDKDNNYLCNMFVGESGFMNQPDFWRAIDTIGVDIDTPDYIESLSYDIWQ